MPDPAVPDLSLFSDRARRYWLGPVLGSGSTGTVRAGWDPVLKVLVAVKEMPPPIAGQSRLSGHFRQEAEMLMSVANSHVVRLFDQFELAGRAYLVMELVDGPSLRTVMVRHGRLTPEQALGAIAGALNGLARVHELGVIHRDVKPENVLLDANGVSKVVDFGLAGIAAAEGTGAFVGSPGYASPEAIRGAELDPRSDLYSTGVVLFELLAGRPPFVAANTASLMALHLRADPPELRRVPGRLARLCAAAMAKDPTRRPQSAPDMLAELEEAARDGYGVDWLARSSLAAVVTAVAAARSATATTATATGASTGGTQVAAAAVVESSVAVPAGVGVVAGAGVVAGTGVAAASMRTATQRRALRSSGRAAGRHGRWTAAGSHPFLAAAVAVAVAAAASATVAKLGVLNVASSHPTLAVAPRGPSTSTVPRPAAAATTVPPSTTSTPTTPAPTTTTSRPTTTSTASVAAAQAAFASVLAGYGASFESSGVVTSPGGPLAFVAFTASSGPFSSTPVMVDVLRFSGGAWHRVTRIDGTTQGFDGPLYGTAKSVPTANLTGGIEPDALVMSGGGGSISFMAVGVVVSHASGAWRFVPFKMSGGSSVVALDPTISGRSVIEHTDTCTPNCATGATISTPYHYDAASGQFIP